MKTITVSINNQPFIITPEVLDQLQETFNVHEVLQNQFFQDAWREYHGQELSETPISTVEYYANDFVWWVVTENKKNYFNVIGLVDCDGNLYHEYK